MLLGTFVSTLINRVAEEYMNMLEYTTIFQLEGTYNDHLVQLPDQFKADQKLIECGTLQNQGNHPKSRPARHSPACQELGAWLGPTPHGIDGVKGMMEHWGQGWEQRVPLSLAQRQGSPPRFGVSGQR